MNDDHNGPPGSSVFYDHPAEAAVLGAMLVDAKRISEVEAILSPDAFHLPVHRLLFETLTGLHADGAPTDSVSVVAHIAQGGHLHRVPDNGAFVAALAGSAPAGQVIHFARVVADRALLRRLDNELGKVRAAIRAGGAGSSADLVERVRTMVADLGQTATGAGEWRMWSDLLEPGFDEIERRQAKDAKAPGISTGLHDLDRVLDGLQNERLIVVAGQPGSGKTTLACNILRAAAFEQRIPTGLFTMEMTWLEVFNRLMCAESAVPSKKITEGRMEDRDWAAIAKVCGNTDGSPLAIDDTKGLTFADIRIRARRLQQRMGLSLLVVDYLGLIECNDNRPRNQQIDDLARRFKNLAGELGIPIVLLAQTNRNASQRGDKRPVLSDLKESGGIEAHANAVIFVHRPDQHDQTKRIGEADLVVAKNRSGPEQDIPVAAQLHLNRFESLALPERTAP